eukprot:maker-scaffold_5-snap-gene-11.48-mRNA-1 protein AED:0.00 eAED:0.00 QI:62/1/1/1/1/1/2/271/217
MFKRFSTSGTTQQDVTEEPETARATIFDYNLQKEPRRTVSESAFCFIFMELVKEASDNSDSISELTEKLDETGYQVGSRMVDLIALRSQTGNSLGIQSSSTVTRIIKLNGALSFVCNDAWKMIYNKPTDQLQKSTENEFMFYIYENQPLVSKFISLPDSLKDSLNCASFNAGIIRGILTKSGFLCTVKTANVKDKDGVLKCVYIVTFDKENLQLKSL